MNPEGPAPVAEAEKPARVGFLGLPTHRLAINGAMLVVAVVVLIVMPPLLNGFLQLLMTKFLILAIFGMGYNLVYGYTGACSPSGTGPSSA